MRPERTGIRPEIVRNSVVLPAPFGADERDDLAFVRDEAHTLQRLHGAIVDGEVLDLEQHVRRPPRDRR
jgi:hypothetical protein